MREIFSLCSQSIISAERSGVCKTRTRRTRRSDVAGSRDARGSGGAIGGGAACGRHFGSIDEAIVSAVLRVLDFSHGVWGFFVCLFWINLGM
ncbi:hypothetical protein JTE90_009915 [Oedothorax gibbosus]|uniref:Uncharacterized protein n=1 Tax=Oedothorax gibbosus TaxID=931172 RepID=A0AAV6UXF6_9ARAC|nr:hypothetical protein JTE90_009915 [Oedothorax gibbosus]